MTPFAPIAIGNAQLQARINPLGADLCSLRDSHGNELMGKIVTALPTEPGQPQYHWTCHAPILFPMVGTAHADTVRFDGNPHAMTLHGFALSRLFSVVSQDDDGVVLALTDDEGTHIAYPFRFRLEVTFRLEGATLVNEAVIVNLSDTAMPASFGFHPAFAWPLPYGEERAGHRLTFSHPEPDTLRLLTDAGTLDERRRPSPIDGTVLTLEDSLFTEDALIWDDVRSDRVTYGATQGPALEIAFPDTPMLGVWTKPGADFVCIEPWHGIADVEGYDGDFRDRPGVFELAAGESRRITMRITLLS